MSLMRKMAKVIQQDMAKQATRTTPYKESDYVQLSNKEDYVYAAAYKDEQQDLWKKLYSYISAAASHAPTKLETSFESLKLNAHNYSEKSDGSWDSSSGYRPPSSECGTLDGILTREIGSELGDVLTIEWDTIKDLIYQIDWTKSE